MKLHVTKLFLFLASATIIGGCKKSPGEGGSAVIKGTLYSQNVRDYQKPVQPDDYEDNQKIYISYGDKDTYDDDYTTSYDGSFQFKYLRKGTYKLFTYSTDPTTLQKTVVTKLVDVKNSSDIIDVKDIVVFRDADQGGKASIKGKLHVMNYNKDGTFLGESNGAEEDVYIIFGDNSTYNDKLKSSFDGTFEFKGLRKGRYRIFTYSSEPNKLGKQMVNIDTTITTKYQNIVLNEMTIKK